MNTTKGNKMRYTKTLNLWAEGVQDGIANGTIKLQRGQWLRCGTNNRPCRLVEVMESGSLHLIHWQGSAARTAHCFKVAVKGKKERVTI